MAHTYQIFEVFDTGVIHNTDKTLSLEDRNTFSLESAWKAEVILKLFDVYGFKSKWDYMFYPELGPQNEIHIRYTPGPGIFWILKRGN